MQQLVGFYRRYAFWSILGILVVFLLTTRFFNFGNELEFVSDNGLEFAVLSRIKSQTCLPNVGPFLSIENIYIPPTYFYYRYFITGFSLDPLWHGYISNITKLFTVAFLSGAIWLVSNKRLFLVGLLVSVSSVFLFASSRLVWHPNPVNLWLSLSIFLLILSKKNHRLDAHLGAWATFWFANSIYPSPFLLLPWYFLELILFLKNYFKSYFTAFLIALVIANLTGLPFYIMQIVFEAQHHWPTVTTVLTALSAVFGHSTAQPFSLSSLLLSANDWLDNLLHSVLFIKPEISMHWGGKIFFVIGLLYLAFLALKQNGHHWLTRFPYVLGVVFLSHALFLHYFLPGNFYSHWYASVYIILVISLFEAAAKLKTNFIAWLIMICFCGILVSSNVNLLEILLRSNDTSESSSFVQKQFRMNHLNMFLNSRFLDLDRTLIINQDAGNHDYSNSFSLQYNAMDNWTLTGYRTLLPPLNEECNAYVFFTEEELREKAVNLILLDSTKNKAQLPQKLFESFIQKTTVPLDENNLAVWYIRSDEK